MGISDEVTFSEPQPVGHIKRGVEALLVDEDGLCLVVRTSVANRDGGFVFALYMLFAPHLVHYYTPVP